MLSRRHVPCTHSLNVLHAGEMVGSILYGNVSTGKWEWAHGPSPIPGNLVLRRASTLFVRLDCGELCVGDSCRLSTRLSYNLD